MEEKLVLFIAHLTRVMGLQKAGEKGYEFALALQTDQLSRENPYVSSAMMYKAAAMTNYAMPKAWALVEQWREEEIAEKRLKRSHENT